MTGSPDPPVRRESATEAPDTGAHSSPASFPPPYGESAQPVTRKNGFGVAALVLAVVALLSVATIVVPIVLGAVAIVFGVIAHGRSKRGIADNGGVAIAGIVLGALAILVGLAFIAIWTTVWKDVRGGDYIDCMQRAGSDNVRQRQCTDQFRRTVQDRLSVTLTPARTH